MVVGHHQGGRTASSSGTLEAERLAMMAILAGLGSDGVVAGEGWSASAGARRREACCYGAARVEEQVCGRWGFLMGWQ